VVFANSQVAYDASGAGAIQSELHRTLPSAITGLHAPQPGGAKDWSIRSGDEASAQNSRPRGAEAAHPPEHTGKSLDLPARGRNVMREGLSDLVGSLALGGGKGVPASILAGGLRRLWHPGRRLGGLRRRGGALDTNLQSAVHVRMEPQLDIVLASSWRDGPADLLLVQRASNWCFSSSAIRAGRDRAEHLAVITGLT